MLASRSPQDDRIDFPRNDSPSSQLPYHTSVLDQHLAAQDSHHGPPPHLPSLPRAVVTDVEVVAVERLVDRGIDDRDISVAPRGDHTFARIEPEDSRGIG